MTIEDNNGSKQDETFMSSDLCANKHLAKLSELLWYENDIKLCTIHPEVSMNINITARVDISIFYKRSKKDDENINLADNFFC